MVETVNTALHRLPLLLLAWVTFPTAVSAHRLDESLQATLVAIEPDGIRLQINLTPGAAVAEEILALIDPDRDGVIATREAVAYAAMLKRDLIVRLDDKNVDLITTSSAFPEPTELRGGLGLIRIEFTVTISLVPGPHRLAIENRHLPTLSVYLVNAARPESGSIRILTQKRSENQSANTIEFSSSAVGIPTRATRGSPSTPSP